MATTPRQRWLILALALGLTLAAASLVGSDQPVAVLKIDPEPRAPQSVIAAAKPVAALPEIDLERLRREAAPESSKDLFRSRSWDAEAREEARRKAPAPPPPRPQAPPLPFRYIGKLVEDGQLTVFLARGDDNLIVRAGEKLDNAYLVNEITEDRIVLTYLPLNIRQELRIGGYR